MAMDKSAKVHGIIHTAATSAAAVGAGLAQAPGSDAALIVPMQLSMITAIALVHGRKVSDATATALLGTSTATMAGRAVSQFLVGWIPGIGNGINAATAFSVTEALGWAADAYFERLGREDDNDSTALVS